MQKNEKWGRLFIVATPIGNLDDITLRAISTLKAASFIFCEDTRVSAKLLSHLGIKAKLISYHQHSSDAKTEEIINILKSHDAALITDAGTPGISDPGNRLIEQVLHASAGKCEIIPIPGPSAVIAALSISGLATDRFVFLGFMPHKKGRETMLAQIAESKLTCVFYESTHRIQKTLDRLAEILETDRSLVLCRELTKKFETVYRGTAAGLSSQIKEGISKGEFVVMIEGRR